MIDTVLLNGVVGAGKTTTAEALSERLSEDGVPHAVVDLDQVRLLRPPPQGDPFQHEVELQNLRSLASNYRAAGAERLILAGVVESATEVPRYRRASGGRGLLVCRLDVRTEVVAERLRRRHHDDPTVLRWHLTRAVELAAILDRARLDDVEIDVSDLRPSEAAERVAASAGW